MNAFLILVMNLLNGSKSFPDVLLGGKESFLSVYGPIVFPFAAYRLFSPKNLLEVIFRLGIVVVGKDGMLLNECLLTQCTADRAQGNQGICKCLVI